MVRLATIQGKVRCCWPKSAQAISKETVLFRRLKSWRQHGGNGELSDVDGVTNISACWLGRVGVNACLLCIFHRAHFRWQR
jgi:hypothetical protein